MLSLNDSWYHAFQLQNICNDKKLFQPGLTQNYCIKSTSHFRKSFLDSFIHFVLCTKENTFALNKLLAANEKGIYKGIKSLIRSSLF